MSEQTVREMAEGALRVAGANVALAVSGIAGPDGGTPEKPVGTVWFCAAARARAAATDIIAEEKLFSGDRDCVRSRAVRHALRLILRLDLPVRLRGAAPAASPVSGTGPRAPTRRLFFALWPTAAERRALQRGERGGAAGERRAARAAGEPARHARIPRRRAGGPRRRACRARAGARRCLGRRRHWPLHVPALEYWRGHRSCAPAAAAGCAAAADALATRLKQARGGGGFLAGSQALPRTCHRSAQGRCGAPAARSCRRVTWNCASLRAR